MNIWAAENFSSFWLANMDHIYGSVRSSSSKGGDMVKGVDGGIAILASC